MAKKSNLEMGRMRHLRFLSHTIHGTIAYLPTCVFNSLWDQVVGKETIVPWMPPWFLIWESKGYNHFGVPESFVFSYGKRSFLLGGSSKWQPAFIAAME